MKEVLGKLTEIENLAEEIMNRAALQKMKLTEKMEKSRKEFDEDLYKENSRKIADIHEKLEEEKITELDSLRKENQDKILSMQTYYERNKSSLVEDIFQKILNY